jgi:hypothetical protein
VDSIRLSLLEAEIKAQLDKIEQVFALLEARTTNFQPDNPGSVESVAYQLHNVYNAIEYLMEIVAKAFENNISDLSRWHTQLLDRMNLEISGVRPALLAKETNTLLHELRAFRHFFRHAYGIPLDFIRVEQNLHKARQVRSLVARDTALFLKALQIDKS